MKKIIAVILAFAIIFTLGVPAYATMAENEPEQIKPEIIESVLLDIANEKSTLAVDFVKEEAVETELPPAVCDHGEEEFAEETEDSDAEENEEEFVAIPSEPADTQNQETSTEDILDYIQSEEVKDALEDAGADLGEIEEEIENGNYEIIYITQEEFEEMRKIEALSHIVYSMTLLGESALILLLIPAAPFLFFIPFAGPFIVGGALGSPIVFLVALGYAFVSPIIAIVEYKNYELDPGYKIVDEK